MFDQPISSSTNPNPNAVPLSGVLPNPPPALGVAASIAAEQLLPPSPLTPYPSAVALETPIKVPHPKISEMSTHVIGNKYFGTSKGAVESIYQKLTSLEKHSPIFFRTFIHPELQSGRLAIFAVENSDGLRNKLGAYGLWDHQIEKVPHLDTIPGSDKFNTVIIVEIDPTKNPHSLSTAAHEFTHEGTSRTRGMRLGIFHDGFDKIKFPTPCINADQENALESLWKSTREQIKQNSGAFGAPEKKVLEKITLLDSYYSKVQGAREEVINLQLAGMSKDSPGMRIALENEKQAKRMFFAEIPAQKRRA